MNLLYQIKVCKKQRLEETGVINTHTGRGIYLQVTSTDQTSGQCIISFVNNENCPLQVLKLNMIKSKFQNNC